MKSPRTPNFGCGKTPVSAAISLAPAGANAFTVTLAGASWKADGGGYSGTFDYDDSFMMGACTGSGPFRFLVWNGTLNRDSLFWTGRRTSPTVLTVTVSKDTAKPDNTGAGTLALCNNDYWAAENSSLLGSTNGAVFLYHWTNDSVYDDKHYKYLGTLTVAQDTAPSVTITIT
jgi:hypothetical protein